MTLLVPAGWHAHADRPDGVLAVLSCADATAVLTHRAGAPDDPAAWADHARAELVRALPRLHVLDVEPVRLGGRPALRLLAHHPVPGGGRVLEQWLVPGGSVLTCTVPAPAYDDAVARTFARIAETVG